MKPFLIFCTVGFFFIQSVQSQDSLKNIGQEHTSNTYYKVYIFKSERHPIKGYLVTIQDSSVFISSYKDKMALNFIDPNLSFTEKIDYKAIQKMKIFNPKVIGRCILIGALTGIVAGAILGYVGGSDNGLFGLSAGGNAFVGGIFGGTLGTAIGAIAGQGYTKEYLIDGEWKNLENVKKEFAVKK
jgi:hypothetical protein